jgi:transporter family-2 protein
VLSVLEKITGSFSTDAGLLVLYMFITCFSGAFRTLVVPCNSALAKRKDMAPERVACLGFTVAATVSAVVWCSLLAVDPSLLGIIFADAEWWIFLGGICGAKYVVQSILTAPILCMAIFVIAGMIGQLSTALSVDTVGLFNSTAVPATPLRLGGVGLVFAVAVFFGLIPKKAPCKSKALLEPIISYEMAVHKDVYSKRRYTKIKELGCGATGSVDSVEDNKLPGQN